MFAIALVLFILTRDGFCRNTPPITNVGIVGGHNITIHDAPFMASLRINGTIHFCGASIIHERFILTAAHCIVPNRAYKVVVGTDRLHNGGQIYDVEKIIAHEKYNKKTFDFDICIIKLNQTILLGPKVQTITLNNNTVTVKRGMTFNSTGWGYTQPKGKVSENLRQVQVSYVGPKKCQLYYIRMLLTQRMMCAGGKGKDTCQGDSGGPLTVQGVQVGITSFGSGCGVLPGVYTRVSKMIPWITKTMNENIK